MNQEQLLEDIRTLPPLAQQEVIDFIAFLRVRYGSLIHSSNNDEPESFGNLEDEPFIGMWKDRDDIEWVRQLREREGKQYT